MNVLSFDVIGEPVGQPRPKATRLNAKHVRLYTPKGPVIAWRALVSIMARDAMRRKPQPAGTFPLSGPVEVILNFFLPRPQDHFVARNAERGLLRRAAPQWSDSKPDIDNLEKAVLDALTSARVWSDDAQVARVVKEKRYGSTQAHLLVTIGTL